MGTKRITDLAALTGASTVDTDEYLIYDKSVEQAKKQTRAEHKIGLNIKPPTQQIFTSGSGTYTTPAGCTAIFVQVVGGGGGGGAAPGNASQASAAQGGQAGGYTEKLITSPDATYDYAVGAGGAGGVAGANNGSSGGNSTFGTALLTANGGEFGYFMTSGTSVTPRFGQATGGAASGGDTNVTGSPGEAGFRFSATSVMSGHGGPGPWGGMGVGVNGSSPGGAAGGPGAGGGGAASASNATDRAGGAGGAGRIIVTEFYE